MNVKNNKKAKMSVENITNAVFDLLKSSSYEELTVKDICKIAGVNRSTFYSHFDSIEDILYSINNSNGLLIDDNQIYPMESEDVLNLFIAIYEKNT